MVPQTADPRDVLSLDNQLCFLVYRLHRGITDLYRPLLGELGLTYPQYLVMLALWEQDQQTVGQLGARLHLDSGTLSPLLKRMAGGGLVHRERSASDERVVQIRLTAAGRELRGRALQVPESLGRCMSLDAQSYLAVRALLRDLVSRLDAPSETRSAPPAG